MHHMFGPGCWGFGPGWGHGFFGMPMLLIILLVALAAVLFLFYLTKNAPERTPGALSAADGSVKPGAASRQEQDLAALQGEMAALREELARLRETLGKRDA